MPKFILIPILFLCVLVGCNESDDDAANLQDETGSVENAAVQSDLLADGKTEPMDDGMVSIEETGSAAEIQAQSEDSSQPVAQIEPENDFQPLEPKSEFIVNTLRTWKDENGLFSTNAELLAVAQKTRQIKLLKENGVTITVSFDRLSEHDRNFVSEFVKTELMRTSKQMPQLVEVFD